MSNTIKIRRGLSSNLPTLQIGELGFTTDTRKLYIGTASGNVEIGGALTVYCEDFYFDDVDTGCDSGIAFQYLPTIDFYDNQIGSVYCKTHMTSAWRNQTINLKLNYILDGASNNTNIYLRVRVWIVPIGSNPPTESSPFSDKYYTISSGTSQGILQQYVLTNSSIPSTQYDLDRVIAVKITRLGSHTNDTYTGVFKLVSVEFYV